MSIREQWLADFWKATDALKAHDEKVAPVVAAYEKFRADTDAKGRELRDAVVAAQAPRHDLQLHLKYLAAALGDSVGERPAG